MLTPPLQRIRFSEQAKYQLITLKRRTGISQWNILARWAFCRSLAEDNAPTPTPIPADSNLEMTWQVFAGSLSEELILALMQYCSEREIEMTPEDDLGKHFNLHLHRGIGYLVGDWNLKKITDLLTLSQNKYYQSREPEKI